MGSSAALIRQLKEDTVVRYPRDIDAALEELTPKQRRFAVMVGAGVAKATAYRECYECDQTRTSDALAIDAHHIAANPKVKTAIGLVANWVDARVFADTGEAADYCFRKWLQFAEAEDSSKALRATELIAKAAGLFVSRSEITHRHVLDLDQADAQLQALMSDLGVSDTIDAMFHVEHSDESAQVTENKALLTPSIGVRGECCPTCGRPIEEDASA